MKCNVSGAISSELVLPLPSSK